MARKKSQPLARPPKLPSRKKARKLTTEFHRLTRLREQHADDPQAVQEYDAKIAQMGGRHEYQRASQTSTSFFSTSKWVLGVLSRNGWLYGRKEAFQVKQDGERAPKKLPRQPTRLLEIGAINTELLDASASAKYKLDVHAIDLNSQTPRILEADFLKIPQPTKLYDVLVCSMVLNCVPSPEQRGIMVQKMADFLSVDSMLFFTIPRTCLNLSPYTDKPKFLEMMASIQLEVVDEKETPKVQFFTFCKRAKKSTQQEETRQRFTKLQKIRQGKKFKNEFAVVLPPPPTSLKK